MLGLIEHEHRADYFEHQTDNENAQQRQGRKKALNCGLGQLWNRVLGQNSVKAVEAPDQHVWIRRQPKISACAKRKSPPVIPYSAYGAPVSSMAHHNPDFGPGARWHTMRNRADAAARRLVAPRTRISPPIGWFVRTNER